MKKILLLFLLIPSLCFSQSGGITIANQVANGPIGTAAATVDKYNDFKLNQTTAGITLTVPNLTNTTPLQKKVLSFINIGSVAVTLSPGGVLNPLGSSASGCTLVWNGTQWSVLGSGSAPTVSSALTSGRVATSGPSNSIRDFAGFTYSGTDLGLTTGDVLLSGGTRAIGTTDASQLNIRTNGLTRINIGAGNGFIGIGSTLASSVIDITANATVAAWGTNGIGIKYRASTFTDNSSSGTVAAQYVNVIGTPTIAASSPTTYTLSGTLFVGAPLAGANVTQGTPASVVLGGNIFYNAGATAYFGTYDAQNLIIRTANNDRITVALDGNQTHTGSILNTGTGAFLNYNQANNTGGSRPFALWTGGTLTGQTASTEITDINFNLSATKTWAAGTIALQRDFRIQGRTYAFASASTVTEAYTAFIDRPIQGTNATITNSAALGLGGNLYFKAGAAVNFGTFDAQQLTIRTSNSDRITIGPTGGIVIMDGNTIAFGTGTGTKIGTATTQKIAFYNSTPIVQPSSTGETVGFTAGAGTNVTDASTFTGNVGSTAYRISDIVKHLKNLGLIAQ